MSPTSREEEDPSMVRLLMVWPRPAIVPEKLTMGEVV